MYGIIHYNYVEDRDWRSQQGNGRQQGRRPLQNTSGKRRRRLLQEAGGGDVGGRYRYGKRAAAVTGIGRPLQAAVT